MAKHITAGPQRLRTICEVHREIYRLLLASGYEERSDEIIKLREAYGLGKKIVAKLRQYKNNFDDGWYEENKTTGKEIHED